MHGMKKNADRILMGKPEGEGPLGRPIYRWGDIIMVDFREIGWGSMDWFDLAQDRVQYRALVNMVMKLQVP
jgi:hypothetical protein